MKNMPIIQQAIGHFQGGIHPEEFKSISSENDIKYLPIPAQLVLPLQQNIGSTAIPVVKVGDNIIKGQILAINQAKVGANLHSPVNGIIKAIEPCYTGHPSGLFKPAIIINTETDFPNHLNDVQLQNNKTSYNWADVSKGDLLDKINQAGIVGLGGATFPTSVKLASSSIKTLIVNAMECEPYITCDDRMLRENSIEVIEGAQIAGYISGAKEIIFAIEDNKPDAINHLEESIKSSKHSIKMSIVVTPTKYPSGGEKQLIELVFNEQVPKGELPASIGILVQNVATLYAIQDAIVNNNPLTHRLVTLTGDLISKPGNYWIPFGAQLSVLLDYFEIPEALFKSVIYGGPLMGQKITDLNTPVTKSTNCIIFNKENNKSKSWLIENREHEECIRCGDCEKACPVALLPQQLYWFSQSEQWEPLENQGLFDCIECGACAYVCPSEIPLVHYYRYGKSVIINNQLKQQKSDIAKKRYELREQRLKRIKDERTLKHQKAAEARRNAANNAIQDPAGKQTAINQALERVRQKKASQNTLNKDEKN